MELEQWLDAFDNFSDEEVNRKISETDSEVARLQRQVDLLLTRAASLRVLLDSRNKARREEVTVLAPAATADASSSPPTVGDVLHRRSDGGTSQAILDLMRTAPDDEWSISRILRGLEANGQLPTSKDPRRAVDATLHRLAKITNEIEREGRGVYRLAKSPLNERLTTQMRIGGGPSG